MAWFCKRCDELLISIGEDYCDNCKRIRRRNKAKKNAIKEANNQKKNKIYDKIYKYKKAQELNIENKYGAIILFHNNEKLKNHIKNVFAFDESIDIEKTSKVIISYKENRKKNKISDLYNKINELKEALNELEDMKNETFR